MSTPTVILDRNAALKDKWENRLIKLCGRTIKGIRYMRPQEMQHVGWDRAPLVLILDDDTLLFASSDDECNDAGMLCIQAGKLTKGIPDGAPVI